MRNLVDGILLTAVVGAASVTLPVTAAGQVTAEAQAAGTARAAAEAQAAGTAQAAAEEVVVVTGFRPERLYRSVGSVSVIDSDLIESRGAEHLEAVIGSVPNVTMTSGASRGRFVQVRGIGDLEQFVDPKHYPSVGIRLDGIDLGGIANAAMLFDVERIEVLRGPQGTRFGASALAGQVDIRSTAPGDSLAGYVDAGMADYGTQMLGAAIGGPLGGAVTGRVAVQQHRGDGYIDNGFLDRDDTSGYDETSLKGKLRWSPRDVFTLDVTALRFDSANGYDAFSLDNTRTTRSDAPGHDDLDLAALGLDGSWQLAGGGAFEFNLSRVDSDVDYGFDEDWAFVGLCDGSVCNPGDGFSNTDRYQRERDDTSLDLRWLGEIGSGDGARSRSGGDSGTGSRSGGDLGTDARPGLGFVLGFYVQDRSETLAREYYGPFASDYAADRLALYGQLDVPLAERLEMTLGFRYERFDDGYRDSFATVSATDTTLRTGEIAFRYSVSGRVLAYAALASGDKPGGVNTEASSAYALVESRFQGFLDSRLQFAQERLTSLELGLKSRSASGRLDYRAAVFAMARDAAQLESWFWDPVNFLWVGILDNADGDNVGAEFEFDVSVSDRWQINASLALLDTTIDALTTFDLDADDFVVRAGIDQTKAPSWQAYLGSRWRLAQHWQVAVDLEATDAQRYGYYHNGSIGRATLVNASLTRTLGATAVTLWARNLRDEDYAVHGLYFGNDPRSGYVPTRYLQRGEPRLVGLTLRHAF